MVRKPFVKLFHTNIFRKTLFRQPIQTLILFLLLAAITYAFVSHAAESSSVWRLRVPSHQEREFCWQMSRQEISIRKIRSIF